MRNLVSLIAVLAVSSTLNVKAFDLNVVQNPFFCLNNCILEWFLHPKDYAEDPTKLKEDTCPDNDHRINELPYWKDEKPLPCMYSGAIEVSP